MGQKMETAKLRIGGMTCISCENKIRSKLSKLDGVIQVDVSYGRGTAEVSYDPSKIRLAALENQVETLGYQVQKNSNGAKNINGEGGQKKHNILVAAIILVILYIMLRGTGGLNFFNSFPEGSNLSRFFWVSTNSKESVPKVNGIREAINTALVFVNILSSAGHVQGKSPCEGWVRV